MHETKEQILLAALRLFARNGYEAVSVSDIASTLGLTKGALYRHYANKQAIFEAILHRMEQSDAEHGMANALLLTNIIRFNANDNPTKQAAFPQYEFPSVVSRYARAADYIAMDVNDQKNTTYVVTKPGMTMEQKVQALIDGIELLKKELGIPASIKEWGVDEKEFLEAVDELSVKAFDDQCTGSNPRYPLISQIKALYLDSYYGTPWHEEA